MLHGNLFLVSPASDDLSHMSQNELAKAYTRLISMPLKDHIKGAASYAASLTQAFQKEKDPSVESL